MILLCDRAAVCGRGSAERHPEYRVEEMFLLDEREPDDGVCAAISKKIPGLQNAERKFRQAMWYGLG